MTNGQLADYYYFDLHAADGDLSEFRQASAKTNLEWLFYEAYSPSGFHIWYYKGSLSKKKKVTIENKTPVFQLHFEFQSTSSFESESGNNSIQTFPDGKLSFLYLPAGKYTITNTGSANFEIFICDLSVEFITNLYPPKHIIRQQLEECVRADRSTLVLPEFPSQLPLLRQIILDILNCPLLSIYKQWYLNSKVTELLSIQLNSFEQYLEHQRAAPQIREIDKQKMEKVRELILENPHEFYQVAELARLVGTNETYLKKHFKQLFGISVIRFSVQVRMDYARDLLKQGIPIAEVTRLCGYKHISHFTSAFKRFFGYTPGSL